ncbi:MAG: glycosyltransferase family 2 protein [Acetobacter papayae]|uniref:glycosyltransferase family 2 protein n=1 Tax=Acetobacter papayae TaxID=1076592 RepID=UPI0039EB47AC
MIDYQKWIVECDTITQQDEAAIKADIALFSRKPLLSVIMATYETSEEYLVAAIQSVRGQMYENWELCIADDASRAPHVALILRKFMAEDPRIRVVFRSERGHISAATNSAIGIAKGEWLVFMDHDDVIARDALYELVAESIDYPNAQLIYTDEDKIDDTGHRYQPYFKPDFDPDLLLGQNMINHLTACRRDLMDLVGVIREGFEGSQDHDFVLRATAICGADAVRHIPRVLYHWRQVPDGESFSQQARGRCVEAAQRAIAEHLELQGIKAEMHVVAGGHHRIVLPLPACEPLVSVIIPTRDRVDLLRVCMDGLLYQTQYPALEILIADNDSVDSATLDFLQEVQADPRVKILKVSGPFNFSHIVNTAVAQARGDVLLLLNNDVEVIEGSWLREMVSHVVRPEIGAVGCRLLYPDGRLQHGGTALGAGGVAAHILHGTHREDPGPFNILALLHSVSAVTAACLAIRKDIWKKIGGMDEINLTVAFNDVDLCLKVRELGLRIAVTPFAELYHHESASRGYETTPEKQARFQKEVDYMQCRWGDGLLKDIYYNPNFTLENANFTLAFPPRKERRYRRKSV